MPSGGQGFTAHPLLDWLREDYPELFEAPDLGPTALVCTHWSLYDCDTILFWPPKGPEEVLDPGHPVLVLRRLIDGPLDAG